MKYILRLLFFACAFLFLLSGCQGGVTRKPVEIAVPEQKTRVEEGERVVERPAAEMTEEKLTEEQVDEVFGSREDFPWSDIVKKRLDFYRQGLEVWENVDGKFKDQVREPALESRLEWRQCGEFFREMVNDYSEFLRRENPTSEDQYLWGLLGEDFRYLRLRNSLHGQLPVHHEEGPDQGACRELLLSRFFVVIKDYAARRQYDEGIEAYEMMRSFTGKEEIPAAVKEIYGQALIEQGRLKEGLDIFMEVLAENGKGAPTSLSLRRETIGYIIAVGDFDRARLQLQQAKEVSRFCCEAGKMGRDYEELLKSSSDYELQLYSEALRAWLVSDRQEIPPVLSDNVNELKQAAPESEAARLGTLLLEQAEKRVEKYVYRELSRAVEFVKANDFSQALEIVDNLSTKSLPSESRRKVKATEAAIQKKQAEEELRQEKLREEALAAKWDKAVGYLDSKEYDKALEYFRSLLDTEYRQQATAKISEAIRLAATSKRQKAAELFIQARDTENPEQKVAFLKQSRQLLLAIQEKYPEASVIDKVIRNLQVVEEAMMEIDPNLLQERGTP